MSRRFQFSLLALMVAMLVVGAFLGGIALCEARSKKEIDAKIDYYEQDRAQSDKVLREVVGENIELRERLGLPLGAKLSESPPAE
jgi:hypothetical protein